MNSWSINIRSGNIKYLVVIGLFVFGFSLNAKQLSDLELIALVEQQGPIPNWKQSEGYVQNEKVAAQIAELVLRQLMGKDIEKELPFKVYSKESTWAIFGKRQSKCDPKDTRCFSIDQDPVYMEINKKDGAIIKLYKRR